MSVSGADARRSGLLLAFDTATAATAVALEREGGQLLEARHDPPPGDRPGHASRLLDLIGHVLADAGAQLADVERIAVGVGPGSFTGLRIGVATARALAQATGAGLAGVSTRQALAEGTRAAAEGRAVAAVLDARRGEAFAAAWQGERRLLAPTALPPDGLAAAIEGLGVATLAVGEGALRFRAQIEPAGAAIPPDDDPVHRVSARPMCALARAQAPAKREAVLPDYLRLPDAELNRRQQQPPWPPPRQ